MDYRKRKRRERRSAIAADRSFSLQRQAGLPVASGKVGSPTGNMALARPERLIRRPGRIAGVHYTGADKKRWDKAPLITPPGRVGVRGKEGLAPLSPASRYRKAYAASRLQRDRNDLPSSRDVRKTLASCKERPKDNAPRSAGSGSAGPRRFVPWCKD